MFNSCKQKQSNYSDIVLKNEIVVHNKILCNFTFYNESGQLLDFDLINFGCSCMNGNISKKTISPLDTANIRFSLNIDKYNDTIFKKIELLKNRTIIHTINLTLIPKYQFKLFPMNKLIYFNNSKIGQIYSKNIFVENRTNNEMSISNLNYSNKNFEIYTNKYIIKPFEKSFINIYFKPKLLGLQTCELNFKLNSSNENIKFYIYGLVN